MVEIVDALEVALNYGQIDGENHKMWVIDQMVRALCLTKEDYDLWVKNYEEKGKYEWDKGIAP